MNTMLEKFRQLFQRKRAMAHHQKISDLNKKLVFSQSGKRLPSFHQLRYIFVVFSRAERIVFSVAFFILLSCAGTFFVRYYYRHTEAAPVVGGTYSEAVVGFPQYINPILSQTSDVDSDITRLVFSGLFTYNDNQELVNDLVNSYAVSDDQLTYTFYLRQDAKWHDGEPFTADDVVFTVHSIQDPNFKSPLAPSLKGVEANKIDDYTFNLVLSQSFAPFLSGLTFGILPEHLWSEIPAANAGLANLNLKPIGTGSFKFDALTKDKVGAVKSYSLVRNENYYAQSPYLERVDFLFFPDIISAVDAAKKKDVDGLAFISKDDKDILDRKNKNLDFYSLRLPQYTAVFFNQKNKLLAIKEIRQALALSFDKNRVVTEALGGAGEVIYTPILPGYLGHNSEVEKYEYDPVRAGKVLDDAGWIFLEGDTVRHKGATELAFTVTTVDQPEYLSTLHILEESWKALGIRVETKVISPSEIQTNIIKPRDYEALLFGEIVGIDPDPYPFWHSSQSTHPGLNLAVFFNKNGDQLLEEARQTTDLEQRRMKYLHFQNILADELPAIFLYNPLYTYAVSSDIHGMTSQYITMPSDRLRNISHWYIKTNRHWIHNSQDEAASNSTNQATSEEVLTTGNANISATDANTNSSADTTTTQDTTQPSNNTNASSGDVQK